MTLTVVGTGSSGNSYVLDNGKETLVLDFGLDARSIKKALGYNVMNLAGGVVSHIHNDHCKSAKDFENVCPIYKPYENNVYAISPYVQYGSYLIQAFDLPHNGTDNYGFLIRTDNQSLLYMTDFEYCKYNFRKLKINHMVIECNYQDKLVRNDLPNYEHKIRGHCSLDTCLGFIKANETTALKTVTIIHMGYGSCDPQDCVNTIKSIVGPSVAVDYARPGLEIQMNETPF